MAHNTEFIFTIIALVASMIACIVPLYVRYGLKKLKRQNNISIISKSQQPCISVIIASRNEEKNISRCLDALLNQHYPEGKFEIIIVNDRSTDATDKILDRYQKQQSNIKVISISKTPSHFAPKKFAIDQGVRNAKHNLLFFTDADCEPEQDWLSIMAQYFSNDIGVVIGYSPIRKSKYLINVLSRFETYRTAAMMFGFAMNDKPYMSVGRNWAYRKQVYFNVHGMESIQSSLSGDDDLLLQMIVKKTKWRVQCCFERGAYVWTNSESSFISYMYQTIRHFSASASYSKAFQLKLGLSQLVMFLCLALSLFVAMEVNPLFLLILFFPLSIQMNNILFIARATEENNVVDNIISFLFEPMFVIFYSILGILGIVSKPRWK